MESHFVLLVKASKAHMQNAIDLFEDLIDILDFILREWPHLTVTKNCCFKSSNGECMSSVLPTPLLSSRVCEQVCFLLADCGRSDSPLPVGFSCPSANLLLAQTISLESLESMIVQSAPLVHKGVKLNLMDIAPDLYLPASDVLTYYSWSNLIVEKKIGEGTDIPRHIAPTPAQRVTVWSLDNPAPTPRGNFCSTPRGQRRTSPSDAVSSP